MVLRSSLLFAQLLQVRLATRTALDHFGAWILCQPAIDPCAVQSLVGLEGDWQAADALMAVADDGDVTAGLMAAAAVRHTVRRLRDCPWLAAAGIALPWLPALAADGELLAAQLAGFATAPVAGITPAQRQRQEQLATFVGNVLLPQLPETETPVQPTGALLLEMASQGAWTRGGALADGGQVTPLLDHVLDAQAFAAAGPGIGLLAGHPVMAVEALLQAGSEAQRQQWLPGLATGENLGTVASRESTGGDDPAGWTTVARPSADGWVLDGAKIGVWFAGPARWLAVPARRGHPQGELEWFVLAKAPSSGPVWRWEGPDGGHIEARLAVGPAPGGLVRHDLLLRGLHVPVSARLGDAGPSAVGEAAYLAGWVRLQLHLAGVGLGVLHAAYDAVWQRSVGRVVAGRQGLDAAVVREQLAGLAWRIQAARHLTYRTARRLAPGAAAAALAQHVVTRTCAQAADLVRRLLAVPGPGDAALWRSWQSLNAMPVLAGDDDVLALAVIGPSLLQRPRLA